MQNLNSLSRQQLELTYQGIQEAKRRGLNLAKRVETVVRPDLDDWISADVTIEEPQGDTMSVIPFHLWPAQRDALGTIQHEPQVIILKARQLGISWLCIAYALWLCLFHANKLVMVFSKDQDSANEMIRRAKGIYQRLQRKPVTMTTDNVTELGWTNGSRFKAFAATKHAGSSFTASLTILDEFAKIDYAESLYTAVKPTINDGGKMIVLSSGQGEGNPFHVLWKAAEKQENSFKAIFLPWQARPDRTPEWYAAAERDAISSAHHRQEYPAEPSEAFQSIGEDRFLPSILLWDACHDPDLPPLTEHEPLVIAIDAAVSNDSFGLVGVTGHPQRRGEWAIRIALEWKPPKNGKIDFRGNADAPGPDYTIRNLLVPRYAVIQVCYDPFQLESLCADLMRDGIIQCVPFSQQSERLEADKFFYDAILARRVWHDGNPALRAHIDNANRKIDSNSSRLRIVKREEPLKIDLSVCASMALYTAQKLGL